MLVAQGCSRLVEYIVCDTVDICAQRDLMGDNARNILAIFSIEPVRVQNP